MTHRSAPARTLFPAACLLLACVLLPACDATRSASDERPRALSPTASESALQSPPPTSSAAAQVSVDQGVPAVGESRRVGGDRTIAISGRDGDYRYGPCRVDTPLPVGYPEPTPPGAIDLKTYPQVRRAEVSGVGEPDRGMNRAFWPLFNHIKGHGIAMTSPVEMDYRDLQSPDSGEARDWTMAFLYRSPDMNAPGVEGSVRVRDAAPVTVIAVGLKGDYAMSLVRKGMAELDAWLAAHPEWEPAGPWRSLYYNGPALFWWNKWAEVQRPIRPVPGLTAG